MFTLAIIGGGFSGTVLAIQLLQKNKELPLTIQLIEKENRPGKGIAYSTDKEYHLLNVPASNMSALSEDPAHFVNWLKEKNSHLHASAFVSRKMYGEYLSDLLTLTIARSSKTTLQVIYGEATDVDFMNEQVNITLGSEKIVRADKVVFAMGNFPPGLLPVMPENFSLNFCNDPWTCFDPSRLKKEGTLLIIGTGLTMVDTCLTLFNSNYSGKIISISSHGYLPTMHSGTASYPGFYDELKNVSSALDLAKLVKKHIRLARKQRIDWRAVVDSLRPYTQQLWIQLPKNEKRIFMKHLNRMWNVGRHRIPPECHSIIKQLIEKGQLTLMPGKILHLTNKGDQIEVELKENKNPKVKKIMVDFVLNCTGPQQNYTKLNSPLVKNILSKGIAKPGPLNIGIEAYPNGKVISHISDEAFYTIGPPLAGVLYESTAVPEIRVQASNLASQLVFDFKKMTEQV